jgi:hypothetical protein
MEECAFVPGCLPMGIGSGSVVRKALIDKNARIGENVQILNKEGVVENLSTESKGYVIRDGIVVVSQQPCWDGAARADSSSTAPACCMQQAWNPCACVTMSRRAVSSVLC